MTAAGRPVATCHGDAHCMNMFVPKPGSGGKPKLVDWQMTGRFPCVTDLAYMMNICLWADPETDDRVYASYIAALRHAGCRSAPTIEEVRREVELIICIGTIKAYGAMSFDTRPGEEKQRGIDATHENRQLLRAFTRMAPRLQSRLRDIVDRDALGVFRRPE